MVYVDRGHDVPPKNFSPWTCHPRTTSLLGLLVVGPNVHLRSSCPQSYLGLSVGQLVLGGQFVVRHPVLRQRD